jgi:hypothetical protein
MVPGIMARWNIAHEFVRFLDPELLPRDHALRAHPDNLIFLS